METTIPTDYEAALEEFRKEEHTPDNPVRSADKPAAPPMIDGYVDYQAVIAAWDKEQRGLYTICLKTKKRNPSHDPERD